MRVLGQGGVLHLRSDDEVYFKDALILALFLPCVNAKIHKNQKLAITSKYEARWERHHKDIYDLKLYKGDCADNAPYHNGGDSNMGVSVDSIISHNETSQTQNHATQNQTAQNQ